MRTVVLLILATLSVCQAVTRDEIVAREYIKNINKDLARQENVNMEALWIYNINVTDFNEMNSNNAAAVLAKFKKDINKDVKFDWKTFDSVDLQRQFKKLTSLKTAALPENEYAAFLSTISTMQSNYAKVKVCDYQDATNCNLAFEPDLEHLIQTSRDHKELEYYWREFYDKAGTPVRKEFEDYVDYYNRAAKLNNYTSAAEMWLSEYEDDTFEEQLVKIMERLNPLYQQFHAYVRYKLNKFYGDDVVSKTGPIPMHLLGNMWGQHWRPISDIVAPFPDKQPIDVTEEMVKQNYTAMKMFEMADDFFTSLGLIKLPQTFWEKSVLVKPDDGRDIVCHGSAWDFYSIDDVRIKMCTTVTMDKFFVVHHECGHIQYYLQYQNQPFVYRTGANWGFHEAVGDIMSLSISTPKHLQTIGLLKDYVQDDDARINELFLTALDKISFIPFAYSLDKYRWAIFRGEIDKKNWNCEFWRMREELTGVEPPVVRSETDFDPPAKYHVSSDVEYLRYVVSYIIQFQFYKTACIKAGEYDPTNTNLPLSNCDFYGSKEAGDALSTMLSLGASKPWTDVLEDFNGERTMTADAIAEYFEPLRLWLEAENKRNNIPIGWTKSDKCSR